MKISEIAIHLLLQKKRPEPHPAFLGLGLTFDEILILHELARYVADQVVNLKENETIRVIKDYCQKKTTDELKLVLSEIEHARENILQRELNSMGGGA
jgi:predicted DNA-binding antitoxin AbrB/MazE fold protein